MTFWEYLLFFTVWLKLKLIDTFSYWFEYWNGKNIWGINGNTTVNKLMFWRCRNQLCYNFRNGQLWRTVSWRSCYGWTFLYCTLRTKCEWTIMYMYYRLICHRLCYRSKIRIKSWQSHGKFRHTQYHFFLPCIIPFCITKWRWTNNYDCICMISVSDSCHSSIARDMVQ